MDENAHTDSNGDQKCDICEYPLTGEEAGNTGTPGNDDATNTGDGDKNKNCYLIWIILVLSLILDTVAGVVYNKLKKKKETK